MSRQSMYSKPGKKGPAEISFDLFPVKASSRLSMFGTTELSKMAPSQTATAESFSVSKADMSYLAHSLPLRDINKGRPKEEDGHGKRMK
jgi:hypothetical protein